MRIQPLLTAALGLGLLAPAWAQDNAAGDKIMFQLRGAKGSTHKLATRVALTTKLIPPAPPGGTAGGTPVNVPAPTAIPAGKPEMLDGLVSGPPPQSSPLPAVIPAPLAAVGMETSATAALDDAYEVVATGGNGSCLLQPTLAPPVVKLVPVPLGFEPGGISWSISPLLRLKVSPTGEVEVAGLAQFAKARAEAAKDAGPGAGSRTMPIEAQQRELKSRLQLATYWMPNKAVAIGDNWPMKLEIPLAGAEELSAPITGTCTLASRDHGKSTITVKGGATGTLTVDEASGWLLSSDLKVKMPGANPGKVISGRIVQKAGQ